MKFREGNKLGQGRPKGSRNKVTDKIKEVFREFPEKVRDEIELIPDLTERVRLRIEVLKMICPKPVIEFEADAIAVSATQVTEDQLRMLVKVARGEHDGEFNGNI